jgi:polyisoprenoid-binding protein YceI
MNFGGAMTRSVPILLAVLLLGACGGTASLSTASPAPTVTATQAVSTPTATTAATTPTANAATSTWTVGSASKAVVSVREQLVGVSLPSDAVLTATGGAGTFGLKSDGSFSADSKITFDLTTLSSDSRDRDNFVKQDTLNTRQFPKAEFVPTKTSGLTLPLASTGTFTFALTGNLTIHGKTKEVTFNVVAKRNGADLTATATLAPTLKFADFGMSAPSVPFRVVSVVDEIRLVVELTATGAAA